MPVENRPSLFQPASLGDIKLKNRVVYPAMTRGRCVGRVVGPENIAYYGQRTTAGLIVTEPSSVSEGANGFCDTPGMYTLEQMHAWTALVNKIHSENCTVVAQLWHTGRMSHSSFHHGGAQIVSASALPITSENSAVPACGVMGADGTWKEHETPRELSTTEVEAIVDDFGKAAALAVQAGFDGVEIHAASGYLIDTFLQSCSNQRTDRFGGDVARRFTLLGEIVERVAAELPASRIGVKLSPNSGFNGMGSADNADAFVRYAARLSELGVAYLHVQDGVGTNGADATWFGKVTTSGFHNKCAAVTCDMLGKAFGSGGLIANGGYTAETAAARVASGGAAAVSFGRPFMANPDLAERIRLGRPLAPLPPTEAWFDPSARTRAEPSWGYTTFAPYSAARKRVLHLIGSPTSSYYEQLSIMYAQGCVASNRAACADEFEFVFAIVHPEGRAWSFPADLTDAAIAAAPRCAGGEAMARLATLRADVAQSHMFCYLGVSTYRAMLDLLGVPFVGGAVEAMCLTTHKGRTNAVVAQAGVPVAEGEVLRRGEAPSLTPPFIVKPCSEDNSMGLAVVREGDGSARVAAALETAFKYDDEVLVERFVPPGREIRFAVLEDEAGEPTVALPAVEYFLSAEKPVRTSSDKVGTDENGRPLKFAKPSRACPADLDDALRAKLVDAATRAHKALGCRDYSLYDFRVDPQGNVFMLEASLFCCFAPNSVIAMMADASGVPGLQHQELFKTLLRRAAARKVDHAAKLQGSKPSLR